MNYEKLNNIQRGIVRTRSNDKENSGSKHTVAILYDNKFYAKSNKKPYEFIPIKINQEDLNNVDYNIQILKNSAMPDQRFGNVMLAAHSGNARISYFRNLDKLDINDNVSISYKGKIYSYKVVNIYDIEKSGKAQIIRNKNVSTLTLVTCRHNTNKQMIVICELVSVE